MVEEKEVQDKLSEVVSDQLSLEQFENWLSSYSWNMHRDSSRDAVDLISSVHLLLSERDDQIFDEQSLKQEFLKLLNVRHFNIVIGTQPAAQMAYLTVRTVRTYDPEIIKKPNRTKYVTSTASTPVLVALRP